MEKIKTDGTLKKFICRFLRRKLKSLVDYTLFHVPLRKQTVPVHRSPGSHTRQQWLSQDTDSAAATDQPTCLLHLVMSTSPLKRQEFPDHNKETIPRMSVNNYHTFLVKEVY